MNLVYAAVESDIKSQLDKLSNPWVNTQSLPFIVNRLITFAMTISIVLLVGMLLWGGIQWITSGGDKEQLSSAQKRVTAAIIGTIVLFSTWAIIHTTRGFFGLESMGGGGGDGGGTSTTTCDQICINNAGGHSYNQGWCQDNCRCIKERDYQKGLDYTHYLENPWCDADTHQYACSGGNRAPDANGSVSGKDLNCSGD